MLAILALALTAVVAEPEAGATTEDAWTGVETTYTSWVRCTDAAARQRAHEAIPADEAGQEAAAACEAEGARWREALGAWLAADHRDAALTEAMWASARCHMARRGAGAAAAYRPAGLAAIRSRGPADERRCPAPAAAPHGEAH